MQTKLSALAARIGEAGWLAAIILVPLLFNVYTERVFEEDKLPLMRSIALLVFVALVVWFAERGREATETDGRPWWQIPLLLPALLLTGAYLLSTLFSIVPRISFWGAYIRRQGTYTWLGYVTIFFSILLFARNPRQVSRIITIILLASVPASLYAFLQNRGLDPLPWGGNVTTRVSSTAGNPIFIAAYLIMVVPLTTMRVIEHFRRLIRPTEGDEGEDGAPANYLASSLLAGAYLFLLIIQLVTIVYSQSRGPLLGLLVGMTFFVILASLPISRKLTMTFAGLTVAGIVFLIVLNIPSGPLQPLRDMSPYINRLGRVFEVDRGTGKVRTLIWEGAIDLLQANPLRDIVGYGPEAMYVAYTPYYPPELAQVEKRNASPDRAHNETLDSLVMTGFLGFAAQLFLFLSLFYYILHWLGLIRTAAQRNAFIALLLLSGAAGIVVPLLLDGSFRYSGVGLPAGLALGLVVYLLGYVLVHLREENAPRHPQSLLLIALLASVLGHFIEAHFGIAIGVTRLYFWVLAAVAVVVGMGLAAPEGAEVAAEPVEASARHRRSKTNRRAPREPLTLLSGTLASLSVLMGLILIVMTFDFYTPAIDLTAKGFAMVWLFVGTWLFGALAVVAEAAFEQEERGGWLPRLGIYAAITLALWAIFCLVYIPWVQTRPITGSVTVEQLRALGTQLANSITVLYLFAFAIIGLVALLLGREGAPVRPLSRGPGWLPAAYGLLALGIVPVIVVTNLNVSRADIFSKQGAGYERANQWDAAVIFYETALNLQPDEDRYFLNMGRAFMEKARSAQDDPAQRDRYLEEARTVLERAQATNPLNTDHARNLASLHRVWASLISDPAEQERHRGLADGYYEQALALSPNNVAILNDWASLDAERGNLEEAYAKLDRSQSTDPTFVNTFLLRANLAISQGDFEQALASYEGGVRALPTSVPALSGRAYALARLDRTSEAIEANMQVLGVDPNDYNSLKNLALLYEETGELDRAMEAATSALAVAPAQERPAMESFIQQLSLKQSSPPDR